MCWLCWQNHDQIRHAEWVCRPEDLAVRSYAPVGSPTVSICRLRAADAAGARKLQTFARYLEGYRGNTPQPTSTKKMALIRIGSTELELTVPKGLSSINLHEIALDLATAA